MSGTANRWLSRWATAAAVACVPGTRDLHCRVEATGVPVRAEFYRGYSPPTESGALHVLVLGGSQGARQLNRLVPAALEDLLTAHPRLEVTHQVGRDHVEEARQAYAPLSRQGLNVDIVAFLSDVAAAICRAHLVISRAGAITLAEICASGRAALLVPLSLAGGHQEANARRMVSVGGAKMLLGSRADVESFTQTLSDLLGDRDRLIRMGSAGRLLARREASGLVADLLAEVAGEA